MTEGTSGLGQEMFALAEELFPICRSITGDGLRESLQRLTQIAPFKQNEVATGTRCFDWVVPPEWNIRDAYIIDPSGHKIVDFKQNNLHVVGYSTPVSSRMSLDQLQQHLYSLPEQPDAIPYVTSYYSPRWGFCMTEEQRSSLVPGDYEVVIDSDLKDGHLTYGELIIPGSTDEEVLLSSYLCHPSMANNELSGPIVTTYLARWLLGLESRRFTYRVVIVPETIGAIVYLSRNLASMRANTVAGFVLTCVGDDLDYSYLPSRAGDTLADQAAQHVLNHVHPNYSRYSYLDRGSDERQYCSPGVDLPVCSMMRSKYGTYPEYHTSLDNLEFVSPEGLFGGYSVVQKALQCLELNERLRSTVCCEPQLGKRGLYPTISTKESNDRVRDMMNFLAYADGKRSVLDIAETIGVPAWSLAELISRFKKERLLEAV